MEVDDKRLERALLAWVKVRYVQPDLEIVAAATRTPSGCRRCLKILNRVKHWSELYITRMTALGTPSAMQRRRDTITFISAIVRVTDAIKHTLRHLEQRSDSHGATECEAAQE